MSDNQSFDLCPECGKRKYRTREKAYLALPALQKKNRRRGDTHPLHAYRCPVCQYWHHGHDPRPVKAVKRHTQPKPRPPANGTARGIDHVTRQWWNVECKLIALGKVA